MNQISPAASPQRLDNEFDPSGFDGVWRLAKSDSTILDPETGEHVEETLADQWLERRTVGREMTTTMHVGIAADLTTHMEFTATLGGEDWVPYVVTSIDGDPAHPALQPGEDKMLKAGTRVGEPIAWIKVQYLDPRTQVRLTKNLDGSAQYVLVSRLSEDGQKLYGYVMTPDGQFVIDKHFVREAE